MGNETDLCAILDSTVSEVVIKNLTTAHSNPFTITQGLPDVNLSVGRGDHLHLGDLSMVGYEWDVQRLQI